MAQQKIIHADGSSKISQYISLVLRQRDLLNRAISFDAEALRILTTPGEAFRRDESRYWAEHIGRRDRKGWTRRDEKRLNYICGFAVPRYPESATACRTAKLLARLQDHTDTYRVAIDEVRGDGTASIVAPLLTSARDAHDGLLENARRISQSTSLPLPDELPYGEDHCRSVCALMDVAPLPKESQSTSEADGPYGAFQWQHNGEVITDTMQPAAWKMVKYLWGAEGNAATFDELKVPVYDDADHIADVAAFGSMRTKANTYFSELGIPWKVRIKGTVVSLTSEEK